MQPARGLSVGNRVAKFYLNVFSTAACAILSVAAHLLRHSTESGNLPRLLWVPGGKMLILTVNTDCFLKNFAVVFITVRLAERAMTSVDVNELEKLRYEYKGA